MLESIFELDAAVRYVAIYQDGELTTRSRDDLVGASAGESDRYEELLVNPTLLKLASQRGNIDCGGLDYLLVRYGNFFQFVHPTVTGHVSVCLEADSDVVNISQRLCRLIADQSRLA